MNTSSLLKHLLSDDESLANYLNGTIVSLEDVKRRMFLLARSENRFIPDHHYRLVQEKTFIGIENLGDALQIGLHRLAKENLHLMGQRIHVHQQKQNGWQELLTYITPLTLQTAFLHLERPIGDLTSENISTYFRDVILPNSRYSALPHPYIPQLEQYINEKKGLHDLHMHLNGATETDSTWQDFLASPEKTMIEFEKAFRAPKVREQLEQESYLLNPAKFNHLLRIAQQIRQLLFNIVFDNTSAYKGHSTESLLKKIVIKDETDRDEATFRHPFVALVSSSGEFSYMMSAEALMYILVFRHLAYNKESPAASFFHFYLLILGLCNRLLVQQIHQHGFEQFQKHTLNGLREYSEYDYLKRFLQIHGNELRYISFLEGRFSPKDTEDKSLSLIADINKGWDKLREHIRLIQSQEEDDTKNGYNTYPELHLVAHFIKREDAKPPDAMIRHRELRIDIWNRATILALILKNRRDISERIVGADAAASEFDAPPEVFGPIFRMLRRKGIKHFTYHAGEDFHHIISGLRTIYEAIKFTDLRNGDRIGHATATGLNVRQWLDAMGGHILIRKGEWLDNLVFAHHLIISKNIEELKQMLPNLINQIQRLSFEIYKSYCPVKALEDAWMHRGFCPMLSMCKNHDEARVSAVYDENEWQDIAQHKLDGESDLIFRQYHASVYRAPYDKLIEIDTCELFDAEAMEALQLAVLAFMHKKEIVIETLPTSNVRIGHHRDYTTYHLWNWIKWEEENHYIPPIVVGTDDTGIFATNIYSEYANIYCHLTNKQKMTHNKAMAVIERLDKNSQIYRFNK